MWWTPTSAGSTTRPACRYLDVDDGDHDYDNDDDEDDDDDDNPTGL